MNIQISDVAKDMSPTDFAALGVQEVAYVRTVPTEGGVGYGIYAADGTELTVVDTRDLAFALVRQNDLEPLSAH